MFKRVYGDYYLKIKMVKLFNCNFILFEFLYRYDIINMLYVLNIKYV